jgi:hypothetical protein
MKGRMIYGALRKLSRAQREGDRSQARGQTNAGPRETPTFVGPHSFANMSRRPRLGRNYAWLISSSWAKSQGLEDMPTCPMPRHWGVHRLQISMEELDMQERAWISEDESLLDLRGEDWLGEVPDHDMEAPYGDVDADGDIEL